MNMKKFFREHKEVDIKDFQSNLEEEDPRLLNVLGKDLELSLYNNRDVMKKSNTKQL